MSGVDYNADCAGLPYARKCRHCQKDDDHAVLPPRLCLVCGLTTGSSLLSYCARCADQAPLAPRLSPRPLDAAMAEQIAAYYAAATKLTKDTDVAFGVSRRKRRK